MEAAKKIFTRAHIIWFLLLNFGLVLLAAGIHFFKSPNNFAMGGTSGISIIAATLLPHMDVGTFMFIINGVLIVLGLVFLGRAVIGATLYSSVALSFYVWVLERAVPMARPFTDDTFLELCYAVILPAAGSAIIFNIGASSGGTDIIAMILSKYTSLEIGKALLVSDFCIALFAGGLYGVRTGLYCVLGLLAKAPRRYRIYGPRRLFGPGRAGHHHGAEPARSCLPAQLHPPDGSRRFHHHRQFQRDHRQGLPRHLNGAPACLSFHIKNRSGALLHTGAVFCNFPI